MTKKECHLLPLGVSLANISAFWCVWKSCSHYGLTEEVDFITANLLNKHVTIQQPTTWLSSWRCLSKAQMLVALWPGGSSAGREFWYMESESPHFQTLVNTCLSFCMSETAYIQLVLEYVGVWHPQTNRFPPKLKSINCTNCDERKQTGSLENISLGRSLRSL